MLLLMLMLMMISFSSSSSSSSSFDRCVDAAHTHAGLLRLIRTSIVTVYIVGLVAVIILSVAVTFLHTLIVNIPVFVHVTINEGPEVRISFHLHNTWIAVHRAAAALIGTVITIVLIVSVSVSSDLIEDYTGRRYLLDDLVGRDSGQLLKR
jgi:hypothetical protein